MNTNALCNPILQTKTTKDALIKNKISDLSRIGLGTLEKIERTRIKLIYI